jgi:polysaccharide biosynthesis/export protein
MKGFGLILGLVALMTATAYAQPAPPPDPVPQAPVQTAAPVPTLVPSAPLNTDARVIQVEDVLRIMVYNEQQMNGDVEVDQSGYISAPFVGMIKVTGKTTAEVEAMLVKAYRDIFRIREPRVSVQITKFRALRATVGGMVTRPSQYEFRPGDTLITLLNLGGGPVPDRADLRRATFRRANSTELIPLDLYAMLIRGDTSQNYKLEDGDELNVPEETNLRVSVQGMVQQPGTYPYKEPMYLSDAISFAHGEIPTKTMYSKVQIIRQMKGHPEQFLHIQANYIKFLDGDSSQNVPLQPGDLILVPSTRTPDINQLSSIIQSLYFSRQLLGSGTFGIKF